MKKVVVSLSIVFLTAGSVFAFGVPSMPGASAKKSASVSMEDAVSSQADLVQAYSNGVKLNLQTQSIMADALGLKDESAKLLTAAESINEGNAKGIDATVAGTKSQSEAVANKMAEGGELSGESKKLVGKSLVTMGLSLVSYKQAAGKAKDSLDMAQSVIKSASMTQKLSAKDTLSPVLSIAPKVPGDLVNIASVAKKYIDFAKSAGIKPPSDLTKALGDL